MSNPTFNLLLGEPPGMLNAVVAELLEPAANFQDFLTPHVWIACSKRMVLPMRSSGIMVEVMRFSVRIALIMVATILAAMNIAVRISRHL